MVAQASKTKLSGVPTLASGEGVRMTFSVVWRARKPGDAPLLAADVSALASAVTCTVTRT